MADVAQGGTLRRWSTFRDGSGGLVDPTDPRVDVLDPAATVIVNDAIPTRDSLGAYFYDVTVGALATLGTWTVRWTGIVDGALLEDEEEFQVVPFGTIGPSGTLCSLDKFKMVLRVTVDDDDALFTEALQDASAAVQDYIERDFLSPLVTEERTFSYNGSGVLDIDDASAINAVYLNESTAELPLNYWTPHSIVPGQSYVWIELPPVAQQRSASSEMGFTRNEDRLFGSYRVNNTVTVDADWGWNDVPRAVQRATIYVAAVMLLDPRGGAAGVSSESVADVARTYIDAEKLGSDDPIPGRAQQLLDPYSRN